MPNWCFNRLQVSVHKASKEGEQELNDFLLASKCLPDYYKNYGLTVEESNFYLSGTCPIPEKVFEDSKTDDCAVLNWMLQNWSCKTEVIDAAYDPQIEENEIVVGFYSAWTPPTNWMKNVSKKFPHLFFKLVYDEEGMEFYGDIYAFRGEAEQCYMSGLRPKSKVKSEEGETAVENVDD